MMARHFFRLLATVLITCVGVAEPSTRVPAVDNKQIIPVLFKIISGEEAPVVVVVVPSQSLVNMQVDEVLHTEKMYITEGH